MLSNLPFNTLYRRTSLYNKLRKDAKGMKSEEEKAKLLLFTDIITACAENFIGRHHQEGNIGHSQLQPPSQEDQLATIHRQDTTETNAQNPGLRPQHPPEADRQRRARGAAAL